MRIQSFSLSSGEIVFLHGRSGCGKTTLLNLLSGVIMSDISEKCRSEFDTVTYVMHESTLLPWTKIKDNLRIESILRKRPFDENLFRQLCEDFGFDDNVHELRPTHLSLGMRQRIELAKAMSFHPSLLLMDEALSGIDRETRKIVATRIWNAVQQQKMTVVGTAHQLGDLLMLAQRVYLINGGVVSEVMTVEEPVEERLTMNAETLSNLKAAKTLLEHTS